METEMYDNLRDGLSKIRISELEFSRMPSGQKAIIFETIAALSD